MTKKGAMAKDLARPREKRTPKARFTWVEPVATGGKRPSGQDFSSEAAKAPEKVPGRKSPYSTVTKDVREELAEKRKDALKK